jgi:hypothetical protein
MITLELARRLRAGGRSWLPAAGDRLIVETPGMEDEVFVLSDMTVEVHEFVDGSVVGFNGTTEWALDSVALRDVLWLPRETQLREALGDAFLALQRVGEGYAVTVSTRRGPMRELDIDVERVYARALLRVFVER